MPKGRKGGTCTDCGARTYDRAHTRCRPCWKTTAEERRTITPSPCRYCGALVPLKQYEKKRGKFWYAPNSCGARGTCVVRDPSISGLRRYLRERCELCGFKPVVTEQLHIDHRLARQHGGTNHPSNLQTLCANCHALKTYIERL